MSEYKGCLSNTTLVDKEYLNKLETQKIAFQRSYKQVYEENKDLKHENKALRLQSDTYFDEWQSDRSLFSFLIENNIEFSIEDHGDVKIIEMGNWTEIHIIDSKYSVYHLRPCKSPIIKEFKSEKEVVNYLSNGVV